MVHVPTRTSIYIDNGGSNETHNIMRVESVAIHTVLITFATHEWTGIFTCSLFSLQAIRHTYTNPEAGGHHHYHHHSLLPGGITDLLEDKWIKDFSTTLHKIGAHTNIRGNDIADAATELTVTH